jgi:hypothetical protein
MDREYVTHGEDFDGRDKGKVANRKAQTWEDNVTRSSGKN